MTTTQTAPVRLTPQRVDTIRTAVADIFGPAAGVWLFGSRTDPERRGGDIDLYIEAPCDADTAFTLTGQLYARLAAPAWRAAHRHRHPHPGPVGRTHPPRCACHRSPAVTTPEPTLEVAHLMQLPALVARVEHHLLGVRTRLFGQLPADGITSAWLQGVLATPEGIDRLESFGAKLGRTRDTLVDKLLPALLRASAEQPGTALDNLNRAERLGLIQRADDWPAVRLTRNRLVHEYFERPDAMLPALKRARDFVDTLCAAHDAIRRYAQGRFVI